jgi:hypothetical protein
MSSEDWKRSKNHEAGSSIRRFAQVYSPEGSSHVVYQERRSRTGPYMPMTAATRVAMRAAMAPHLGPKFTRQN